MDLLLRRFIHLLGFRLSNRSEFRVVTPSMSGTPDYVCRQTNNSKTYNLQAMAYNEKLAARVRAALSEITIVEEKKMFRGIAFLVEGKMCINVGDDEIMCRIDPAIKEELIKKPGCRPMIMKGRELKGYVLVTEEGRKTEKDFQYWIEMSLEFNKKAKASKKRKK